IPREHERRMPLQLAAALEKSVAELDRLDEPLATRDDLERPIAFLVELHGVRDRLRLAHEVARIAKLVDDSDSRLRRRQAREIVVVALRALGVDRFPSRAAPGHVAQRSVSLDDSADRQVQLAPPGDVGQIAEGAIIA